MNLSNLPAEEPNVSGLVREEAAHRLAGEKPFSLYLVGSHATDAAWPTSDFDFVIDADEPLPGKVINPLREALNLEGQRPSGIQPRVRRTLGRRSATPSGQVRTTTWFRPSHLSH